MTKRSQDQLEALVADACRLVGGRHEVRQIIVLTNRRLTSEEFARLQRPAAASQVELWSSGNGVIRLRPASAGDPGRTGAGPRPAAFVDWLRSLLVPGQVREMRGDTR